MIRATKEFTFDGQAPYSWTLTSSNSCAVPVETSGISSTDNLTIEVDFQNEACFDNATFTLTVVDSCGALSKLVGFSIDNPCLDLQAGNIASAGANAFVVYPSGGSGNYTYNWSFDTSIFYPIPYPQPNPIILTKKPGVVLPYTTTISVTVTDTNNCSDSSSLVYALCSPRIAMEGVFNMTCINPPTTQPAGTTGTIVAKSGEFPIIVAQTCESTPINWRTLQVTNNIPGLFVVPNGTGAITFYANTNATPGTYTIGLQVKDNNDVLSNYFQVGIVVPNCTGFLGNSPISIPDAYIFASGEAAPASTYEVSIGDNVAGEDIDWDTFTFVAGTGQTLVTATSLTTGFGSAVLTPGRTVQYTVSSLPTLTPKMDVVMWRVADTNGYYTKRGRIWIDYNTATAPTATADTMCATCGGTTTKDILANDTGDIDPRSVVITTAPTKGNYSIDAENFIFTALLETSGSDVPQYKVANFDGDYSSSVNITITIVCAGEDYSLTSCKTTLDFTDYLSSWATASCTWLQTGGTSTISVATPTAVDFSSATPDTYTFTYTCTSGSCSDAMTLTVIVKEASVNNACSDAIVMSWPTSNTVSAAVLTCDSDTSLETVPSTDQNPSRWNNTAHSGDVWFKFTTTAVTNGSVQIDGTPFGINGIVNPQVAVYSSSSACTIDNWTIINNNAETGNGQTTSVALSGLSATTTYWIRVTAGASGNEGQFNITVAGA